MRVLVTGAGGFLGTWLTRVFVESGHRVRAADIASADLRVHAALGAETAVCDVTRPASVEATMKGQEAVVHGAGVFDLAADPDLLWRVNAEGARLAARTAARSGVKRFVLVSSTGVYGKAGRGAAEDAPKRPRNVYERSKWAGEKMAEIECQRAGLPWAAVRPTLIYGPGSRYGIAVWLALFALQRHRGERPLRVSRGGPVGHHVHVEDVARAAELLVRQDASGPFNVADEAPLPVSELLDIVAGHENGGGLAIPAFLLRQIGLVRPLAAWFLARRNPQLGYLWSLLVAEKGLEPELRPRIDGAWLDYLGTDHTYDNARLKGLGFQFKHPDMRLSLPETVRWYRENRWLP